MTGKTTPDHIEDQTEQNLKRKQYMKRKFIHYHRNEFHPSPQKKREDRAHRNNRPPLLPTPEDPFNQGGSNFSIGHLRPSNEFNQDPYRGNRWSGAQPHSMIHTGAIPKNSKSHHSESTYQQTSTTVGNNLNVGEEVNMAQQLEYNNNIQGDELMKKHLQPLLMQQHHQLQQIQPQLQQPQQQMQPQLHQQILHKQQLKQQ